MGFEALKVAGKQRLVSWGRRQGLNVEEGKEWGDRFRNPKRIESTEELQIGRAHV